MADDRVIAQLDTLFDRERAALLEGRVEGLARIVEERAALMPALERLDDRAQLLRLRRRAAGNAALLKKAGEGIRDAMQRLAEIRAATGPIDSYSADGTRARIGAGETAFEKKA